MTGIYKGTVPIAKVILGFPDPTSDIVPVSFDWNEGDVIAFACTPGSGDGTYTFKWHERLTSTDPWIVIAGETAATYSRTTVLADNGAAVMCQVGSAGVEVDSSPCTMTIAVAEVKQVYNVTVGFLGDSLGWSSPSIGNYGSIDTVVHTPFDLVEITASLASSLRIAYNFGSLFPPDFTLVRITNSLGVVTEIPAADFVEILIGGIWAGHNATGITIDMGLAGTVTLVEFVMP